MRGRKSLVFVVLLMLVSSAAFAQLSDMEDRTSVFRRDVVGDPVQETLCHIPPGNPANAHTIDVEPQDVAAHLAHGDFLGECPYECDGAAFPATGQTVCWEEFIPWDPPNQIDCAGTGQDGDIQAGAPFSYTDNGDGTITDNNTGLMWEKKDDAGGIHDKDTFYIFWGDAFGFPDTLNNNIFAGYDDWRLPNVKELQSIVDYENFNPSVSPAFNTNCVAACTVLDCSCTVPQTYHSSTSSAITPSYAWGVDYSRGVTWSNPKVSGGMVRAVRGGL